MASDGTSGLNYMAIGTTLPRRRNNVAVIDYAGDQYAFLERSLSERGLTALPIPSGDLSKSDIVNGLSAVVFAQTPTKPLRVCDYLRTYASVLLDADCRILVIVGRADQNERPPGLDVVLSTVRQKKIPAWWSDGTRQFVYDGERDHSQAEAGEPEPPVVRVLPSTTPTAALADFVASHGAGPPPSTELQFRGPGVRALSDADKSLLRRAFHNCAELHLRPLGGGKSGAFVFLAHAKLIGGLLGVRPLPYFVKVGGRNCTLQEWQNYEGWVRPYVPFHLAPNMAPERCCLGADRGVLVGDFVDESESLAVCARSGRAAGAIACLFDRTLRGWHLQASDRSLQLASRFRKWLEGDVCSERLAQAKRFGATMSPEEFRARLAATPEARFLCGPIHRDLHADNVRVRGNDAILIDFLACSQGPLVIDPASLESSLVISGFQDNGEEEVFDRQAWLSTIRKWYLQEALVRVSVVSNPEHRYSWLSSCIRQIRLHGFAMERGPGQYARALAIALFRKASKDHNTTNAEGFRRAVGYALATNLVSMNWD